MTEKTDCISTEYDVFISFKSEDYELAKRVNDFLSEKGLSVFFSKESLPRIGNSEYREAIDKALDLSKHMIVICSELKYLDTEWVAYEYKYFTQEKLEGRKKGSNVIVITTEVLFNEEIRCNNKKHIPSALRHEQFYSIDDPNLKIDLLKYIGTASETNITPKQSIQQNTVINLEILQDEVAFCSDEDEKAFNDFMVNKLIDKNKDEKAEIIFTDFESHKCEKALESFKQKIANGQAKEEDYISIKSVSSYLDSRKKRLEVYKKAIELFFQDKAFHEWLGIVSPADNKDIMFRIPFAGYKTNNIKDYMRLDFYLTNELALQYIPIKRDLIPADMIKDLQFREMVRLYDFPKEAALDMIDMIFVRLAEHYIYKGKSESENKK